MTVPGLALLLALVAGPALAAGELDPPREALVERLVEVHGLTREQSEAVRQVFRASRWLGQGNPAITRHPVSEAECREGLEQHDVDYEDAGFAAICGARYMAPLYDPDRERPEDARACIDQFEFPGIPCVYPIVWVRAREAVELCQALGKRLCDAHEWEGACAGALEPPDYRFDLAAGRTPSAAIGAMRAEHNRRRAPERTWSYGPAYRKGVCSATSHKSPACQGGSWSECGSNTFPTGLHPDCRSRLGVYDLHGNAAEHMNLPLTSDQMASRGSTAYGHTEMKGSWFIFDHYYAHEDWCRWRAPYWHGGRVLAEDSHRNYHLGFRCCKTLPDPADPAPSEPGD